MAAPQHNVTVTVPTKDWPKYNDLLRPFAAAGKGFHQSVNRNPSDSAKTDISAHIPSDKMEHLRAELEKHPDITLIVTNPLSAGRGALTPSP